MAKSLHLQVVILAAGRSRRFASNKLLQVFPDGSCMLDRSVQLARHLSPRILLVINNDPAMRRHCERNAYSYIANLKADSGMASSIVCGVTASKDADACAILLADMPSIRPDTLHQLSLSWSAHEITLPAYQGQNGHPVIFTSNWFPALCALHGDQGARELLHNNPAVHRIATDDPGVCTDIDTIADWDALVSRT